MMKIKNGWLLICMVSVLAACARVPTSQLREQSAQSLVLAAGWHKQVIPVKPFMLTSFLPKQTSPSETLTIYIEGDGFAWRTSASPSDNPTPINPVALKMALKDSGHAVAYLARPCQFVGVGDWQGCEESYWTYRRFAPIVVQTTNQAIDALKQAFQAQQLILVGYSGGGAVATLVAARRTDVVELITVAGNIEPVFWTHHLKLKPLSGSLNPADEWQKLAGLPQTHWVGGKDKIISEDVTRAYQQRFPKGLKPTVKVVPEFDHHCCWVDEWPRLLKESHLKN